MAFLHDNVYVYISVHIHIFTPSFTKFVIPCLCIRVIVLHLLIHSLLSPHYFVFVSVWRDGGWTVDRMRLSVSAVKPPSLVRVSRYRNYHAVSFQHSA